MRRVHRGIAKGRSLLGALIGTLLLSACGTVQEHRARQHGSQFATYSESEQRRMLTGDLAEGWDPVAVYIALGTPEWAMRLDEAHVLWVYWGYRVEPVEIVVPPRPIFQTRSEPRLAPRGRPLEQMRILFAHDRVLSWEFAPIPREELSRQRQTPFGQIPDL